MARERESKVEIGGAEVLRVENGKARRRDYGGAPRTEFASTVAVREAYCSIARDARWSPGARRPGKARGAYNAPVDGRGIPYDPREDSADRAKSGTENEEEGSAYLKREGILREGVSEDG